MNLYRNEEASLSSSFFMNPPCEYRGAPFWAWNCEITKDKLDEQIETFRRMGMGGYHIHVRTGLQTPYLSDEYMELVKYCLHKGESSGLLTWLYDEDRWPSGTAGGRVTAGHPEFRAMNLLWTTKAYGEAGPVKDLGTRATGRGGNREENGDLLGAYDVELDESGCLLRYRRISADAPARGQKWYAYAEYAAPSAWFNNQAYIDTLNRSAVEYFVSYYDYYQPEAYIPHTDTFIEKDSAVNEEIDRLRLAATASLMGRDRGVVGVLHLRSGRA